jgi:hypothetical protein
MRCIKCRGENEWENSLHGELKTEPDKFKIPHRERRKSILIERKNKLAEFDAYNFFKITGE